MLLGLAFPNGDTTANDNSNQVTIEQTTDADQGDTGGETVIIPPKK